MTDVSPVRTQLRPALTPLILGGLAPFMVVWDWASRADPVARLWAMPLPVAGLLLALCLFTFLQGRGPGPVLAGLSPFARNACRAAVLLVLAAVLITAVLGRDPIFGMIKLGELVLVALVALMAAAGLRHSPQDRAGSLWAFVLGGTVSVLLLGALKLSGAFAHFPSLALPGFVHIRILGFSLALMLTCAVGIWPGAEGRARHALALCLVVLWAALFWSGGRGAVLAVVAGVAMTALVVPSIRAAIVPLAVTAALGFAVSILFNAQGADFGILDRLESSASAGSADALASGRLEMWATAWHAVLDQPLWGHGYAQARWMYLEAGYETAHLHTHNIVLDAVLALGLPLGCLAGLLAILAWARGLHLARVTRDPLDAAGAALVSVFLVHALVDGIYFYAQGLVPLALGISLLLSARR